MFKYVCATSEQAVKAAKGTLPDPKKPEGRNLRLFDHALHLLDKNYPESTIRDAE